MICRAYVTAKQNAAASVSGLHIPIAVHTAEGAHLDAELHEMRTVDGARFAHVQYAGKKQDNWVGIHDDGNL